MQAAGFEVPDLAAIAIRRHQPGGKVALTLVRGDNPCVESFELWLAPGDLDPVHEALVQGRSDSRWGRQRSTCCASLPGIPRYGVDIRERDLPQETEQERALNFSKGCYVGQEIVERIRSRGQVRRKFTGFEVNGPLPAPGSKIQVDGKDVGEITSAASLPLAGGERQVALGYIRREVATPGRQVEAGGSDRQRRKFAVCGSIQVIRRKELCLRKSRRALL